MSALSALWPLPRAFYARGSVAVARDLLGKLLVRTAGGEQMVCRIVEAEAYGGSDDPASHAFRGRTPRNSAMFGEAGRAYVYFVYGNHYCLNATTKRPGVAGAVLLRAAEPVQGLDAMRRFRSGVPDGELTNGPGKLTKALSIDRSLDKLDLTVRGPLFISEPTASGERSRFSRSARIGVAAGRERQWRFFVTGNAFVSR